jgi:tRNA A-37 threonylcarbamoyl transferase component Bud32
MPLERHAEGTVTVYADRDVVPDEGMADLLHLPEILAGLPGTESRAAGRRTVWRWAPAWCKGRRLVVRQFAHGGALGGLRGTVFFSARPMLRELRIALHLRARGVPTCRPVALRLERAFGPLLRAHYITEEVPDAPDLLEFCRTWPVGRPCPPRRRQDLAGAVARTIAALHDAGVLHKDLNIKNILISARADPPIAFAIDFKKAHRQTEVDMDAGLDNLVRLDRSVVKWAASRQVVTLSDRLRVLREYVRLRSGGAGDWKEIARRIRTRHPAPRAESK